MQRENKIPKLSSTPVFNAARPVTRVYAPSHKSRYWGNRAYTRLQTKLRVSQPGDQHEREADRVAEQVMGMPITAVTGPALVQRQCAACARGTPCGNCQEDDADILQRKPAQAVSPASARVGAAPGLNQNLSVPTQGGQALAPATRAFFEPRFGADFSQVRVHADTQAAGLSRDLNARAFTLGSHIWFGAGEYAPANDRGRHLLAHELTHTLQQGAGVSQVQRQEFEPAPGQLGVETGRREEDNVLHISLDRTTACGYTYHLQLDFNRNDCSIVTPMAVRFTHPADTARRLSPERFEEIADRFIEVANRRLNGWYAIRIAGDATGCSAPCRNQDMPIRVQITRSEEASAHQVELVDQSGRSNSSRFDVRDLSEWRMWHEGGHIALGISDEYNESGVACRTGSHAAEGDWSIMANHEGFTARARMHPRHFSHILHWFETEYAGCNVTLPALSRRSVVDTIFSFETGVASMGGDWGIYDRVVLEHGFPLDAARHARLLLGGQFEVMSMGDRLALLGGLTLGLEYATNRSSGGFNIGLDTMLGGGVLGPTSDLGAHGVGVVEAGGHLGYAGPSFEVGVGARVGVPFSGAEAGTPYYVMGLRLGYSFYLP